MNREELMGILPHRASMLLLDEAFVEEGAAHGRYHVRGDEFFLDGHFPGNPIVPGVILCEILAQSACVLLADGDITDGGKKSTLYTGLDKVRFKGSVRPGDIFETTCRIVRQKGPFYFCEGEGSVDGKKCLTAEFSFAVTEAK